jgi:hypothetical protein
MALILATLLPTKWIPRTGLGWEDENIIYRRLFYPSPSRRPYRRRHCPRGICWSPGGLTPDRFPDVSAALSGAAGVISAATLIIFLI